jgi:hypothetical protein
VIVEPLLPSLLYLQLTGSCLYLIISSRDNKENTKKAIRDSLRKWTKDNNNGNVPNPYKHGPGSDAWWKWSQINFFW